MSLRFFENKHVRVVITLAVLLNSLLAFAFSVERWWFQSELLFEIILLVSVVSNIALVIGLVYRINKELNALSLMIAKASNDNLELKEQSLQEGIVNGLMYQFVILFERLDKKNQMIVREKENMNRLITDLSHQIKTPLASIKLFHSLSDSESIGQEEKLEVMTKMGKEIDRLDWLSSMLLDISKLETGMIQLKEERVNLSELVTEVISGFYTRANEKDIELIGEMDEAIEVVVDHRWTKEAIANIIDNAIKYTQVGGTITTSIKQTMSANQVVIRDTGVGIPRDEMTEIYKRFYKGKYGKSEEGSGVGLYLSKEIIQMMEGSLAVWSEEGVGSAFTISFYRD